MANFAGNLSIRITLRLQSVVFPGVKKNGSISCSGSREYGSSLPTRYVPKKSSKSANPERSSPVKGPKENEVSVNPNANTRRFGLFHESKGGTGRNVSFHEELQNENRAAPPIGGVFFNSMPIPMPDLEEEINHDQDVLDNECSEGPVVVDEEIEFPKERNIDQHNVLQIGKARKDAEEIAIKLLANRAFTAAEMKKKLLRKKFPSAIIDAVVDDFQQRGLINDSLYAETYSQSRWSSSCWGPRRIKHELTKKGVGGVDVDKAVRLVFEGDDSSCDQDSSRLGLSKESLDHLFVQASKQWLKSQGVAIETRKSRIIRWLQYRGFNWGVTILILRRLESQENSEAK